MLKTSFIKKTESQQLEEFWRDIYSDTELERISDNNTH
jgi:hypothetical protein